jgi:hypothetical protein
MLPLVPNEILKAGQKECAEMAAFRPGDSGQVSLNEVGEKALGQILGVLGCFCPCEGELVQWLPVILAQASQRRVGPRSIKLSRPEYAGPPR